MRRVTRIQKESRSGQGYLSHENCESPREVVVGLVAVACAAERSVRLQPRRPPPRPIHPDPEWRLSGGGRTGSVSNVSRDHLQRSSRLGDHPSADPGRRAGAGRRQHRGVRRHPGGPTGDPIVDDHRCADSRAGDRRRASPAVHHQGSPLPPGCTNGATGPTCHSGVVGADRRSSPVCGLEKRVG